MIEIDSTTLRDVVSTFLESRWGTMFSIDYSICGLFVLGYVLWQASQPPKGD